MTLRKFMLILTPALVLSVGLAACELDERKFEERTDDTFPVAKRMGTLGNSLTAGFQNGGIRQDGQLGSFPNLMSQRILGRELQMPLVDDPGIGSEAGLSPLVAENTPSGVSIERVPLTQEPTALALNLTYPVAYDNLGVPGATTRQMLNTLWGDPEGDPDWQEGRDAANPLFNLILRNAGLPGGGSMVQQLERVSPDIITVWTGNNEILGGSLSGSPQSADSGADGFIVPVSSFEPDFIALLDRVEALEPEMVAVANVPPIAAIPYARTWRTWPPTAVPNSTRWNMEEDHDDNGDPDVVDSDPVQLVLLPAPVSDCIECYHPTACGGANPCTDIPAEFTLSVSEVQLINDTIAAYNVVIQRETEARGWAYVDINAAFLAIPTSGSTGPLNTAFPVNLGTGSVNPNSAFTLDGVHPSERGAAELANQFLTALNDTYDTEFGMYDLTTFENYAGLELVRSSGKVEPGPLHFTPEARAGLSGMVKMMQARY